ncbi:GGDEF domain-containing protein [Sporosarcina sp. NCCP-2222]|uniref:putative bifunctional diguanylate cyclase/phosphodiesterase n=1 Tax=Sporosarcina sp. NCCP-2222 TaxID=2935073 RepID=UPI00208C98E1|nr:bifunctional diguanylate cyclase/phosphodiesterase [Sporosarcina sp. NCCP-2222]GKV55761.1 GGDEF domain-containing protein [Sporosarcina sp. NCCP-2222]
MGKLVLQDSYIQYMETYVTAHPYSLLFLIGKKDAEDYLVLEMNEAALRHFPDVETATAAARFGSLWHPLKDLVVSKDVHAHRTIICHPISNEMFEVAYVPIETESYEQLFWIELRFHDELAKERKERERIHQKYTSLIEDNLDPIITVDCQNDIIDSNRAVYSAFGYHAKDLVGKDIGELFAADQREAFTQLFSKALKGESLEMDGSLFCHKLGHYLPAYVKTLPVSVDEETIEIHLILRDTSIHSKNNEKLLFLSYHDQLTGLWNRKALKEHFDEDSEYALKSEEHLAFIHVDLDRFSTINEALGRTGADEILKKITERIKVICPRSGKLYRNGGDEFIITMRSHLLTDVEKFSQKILSDFSRPFYYHHQEYFLSASIGIAVFPENGKSLEELLHKCERAIQYVKDRGRAHYRFYQKEMNTAFPDTAVMEAHLRRAIEFEELEIHYQPQVNLKSGHISSFEALLRWNNRKFGFVSPATFIPIAEASGLIHQIGEWVLDRVCSQLKEWSAKQFRPVRIAVNISPQQFQTGNLADNVKKIIRSHGIQPSSLEVEITESALMHMNDTLATLNELKSIGVTISVDDFGTGYSSLSYLKSYPIDIIKIDRSFVKDIESDEKNEAIAKTIINLAHNLGMEVIAEGVEKDLQAKILKDAHCHKAQGFLFSKAIPAKEVVEKYFKEF